MSRLAMALGGGGARGMAYIGVFRVLEEEGIRPDLMVGTSIGALTACMWSYSGDWKYVREKTKEFLQSRKFRKYGAGLGLEMKDAKAGFWRKCAIWTNRVITAPRFVLARGLFSASGLHEAIRDALPDLKLEDLPIPVAVVALDLVSTQEEVITRGSAREACSASANLAGFFAPVEKDGKLLVDCSSVASLPVLAARRLGAGKVIALDIRSPVPQVEPKNLRNALNAVLRLGVIASDRANTSQVDAADLIIRPEVGDVFWSDFRDMERLEAEGERATREKIDDIRKLAAE